MSKIEVKRISAEETWELRHKVMWPDKDIEYIKLLEDKFGIHYGVFDSDKLVSAISIFEKNKEVQFRKYATVTELQGRGYGTILLTYVLEQVAQWDVKKIWCNARKNKVDFYTRFGFQEKESAGTKDGVEYVIMSKNF